MKFKIGDVVRFKDDNNKRDYGKVKSITKDGQVRLWRLVKDDITVHSSEVIAVLKGSEKFGDIVEDGCLFVGNIGVNSQDIWYDIDKGIFVLKCYAKKKDEKKIRLKIGDIVDTINGRGIIESFVEDFPIACVRMFDDNSLLEFIGDTLKLVEQQEPRMEEKYVIVANRVTVIPLTYDQAIADAKQYCKAKNTAVTIYKAVAEVVPEVTAVVRGYKDEAPKESGFTVSIPHVEEPYLTQVKDIISKHFEKKKPHINTKWLPLTVTLENSLGTFDYHIDDKGRIVIGDADILLSFDNIGHRVERVKYISLSSHASIEKDIA